MIYLSVIIPAHNEADRIGWTLDKIIFHLQDQGCAGQAEILVVENGSTDNTAEQVEHKMLHCPWLRLLRTVRADKGHAVRAGMLAARGRWRYMADADLSTDIQHLWEFFRIANRGHEIVIAHRDPVINQTRSRAIMSTIFHALTSIVLPGIKDTQAGFKLFSSSAAEAVFSRAEILGWAFDVEILWIARMLGLSVGQVSVPWINHGGSKVKPLTGLIMMRDVIRIIGHDYKAGHELQTV